LFFAAVAATGNAATAPDARSAQPASVTIAEQAVPVYPAKLPPTLTLPSPGTTRERHEYLVVRTAAGASAAVLVTVENGPGNLQYGPEKIGKGQQLQVNGTDFPTLPDIEKAFSGELDQVLTRHFTPKT